MNWMNFITATMALVLIAVVAFWVANEEQHATVRIGVGSRTSQAYELMAAVKAIAERHESNLTIEIFETRGSLHNAALLEEGGIDMATVLDDVATGADVRLVADLFPDSYQLLAHADLGIKTVADLQYFRVALPPPQSAEYHEFWFLMSHYGLTDADIDVVGGTPQSADWAFITREADALFRIRAPGNQSILSLIDRTGAQLVPIAQAPALRLKKPAIKVSDIPTGSYRGEPPVPDHDLLTASLEMLLIAHKNLSPEVVKKVTEVLFERRRELVSELPLAGQISEPDTQSGTFLPLHDGAKAYYLKDKPSFLQEQAELIALAMSILAVLISGLLQLLSKRKKVLIDTYNRELLELAAKARAAVRISTLSQYRQQLGGFVGRVVNAAESGQINADQFDFFTFTYESVEQAINQREDELARDISPVMSSPAPSSSATVGKVG